MSTVHEMAADIVEGYGEEPSECPCEQDLQVAALLIAKGWVKPRTITTVEELDALPVGSAVLHNGRAFQHYPAYPAPFDEYQQWKCGDGGFVRSTKDGSSILPALVLFEGQA